MLSTNMSTRIIKKCAYLLTIFKRYNKSHEITFSYCVQQVRKRTSGSWSVLFFGTDNFSVESLRSLYNEYRIRKLYRLEVVSTYKEKKNAVIQFAEEKGIIVNQWPLENNPQNFDVGVVVSFGHLIPSNIINSFPLGILNVHASLLPRWRGAAPIIYSLINGDTQTGITIMKVMPEKFDIGEIIIQEKVDIHADETLPELHNKLAKVGANVLLNVVRKLPHVLLLSKPQEKTGITYAPKISSKISSVKWDAMTAKNVYDLYRGLLGLYPLTTKFGDKTVKLLDIRQVTKSTSATNPEDDAPGSVTFDKASKTLIVTCKGRSWVSINRVIIAGRPPMSAADFRNGFMRNKIQKQICFRSDV